VTVTILAPAYDEEAIIERFVSTVVPVLEPGWELLVIDDGSTDATPRILARLAVQHPQLRVLTHPQNRGLGSALATGFASARGDLVATMDADLSHALDLLPTLVAACDDHDAAFASRYVAGGGMVGIPWRRRVISRTANLGLRAVFMSPVRDLTTGYRVFRTSVVRQLPLRARGFEVQLEISVRLLAAGRRIAEIPLVLTDRSAGSSKMRYLRLIRSYGAMVFRLIGVRYRRRGRA
jgi:dolichol-phosphate mannosyltransferase